MSRFVTKIEHIPTIKRWVTSREDVTKKMSTLGLEPLYNYGVHARYYYTDIEGAVKLLPHLIQKSNLYKSTFTCINYAFRVWEICGEIHKLNTWVPVIGRIPNCQFKHAWILIMLGDENRLNLDKFLYFDPNDGWEMGIELEMAYQAFPIGEEGYKGEKVFY